LAQLDSEYDDDQFLYVDFHTSNLLSCPGSLARASYYTFTGVPIVFFDGIDSVLGAGAGVYSTYAPIVAAHLADSTKLTVSPHVFFNADADTGSLTVTIDIAPGETIENPELCQIWGTVYENGILLGADTYQHVCRLLAGPATLTASSGGEQQTVTFHLTVADSLAAENLGAVAWVQRTTNKKILNAGKAKFTYDVEIANLGDAVQKVTGGAAAEYDVEVTCTGAAADDVILTLDEASLPSGWDAEIVWNSTTYPSTVTFPAMAPGATETVQVRTIPSASPGVGTVTLTAVPDSDPLRTAAEDYHTFSDTDAILFVDDDNGATYETMFEAAILGAPGRFSLTHDFDTYGTPAASYMALFDAVIWNTGELQIKTVGADAMDALMVYLDGGGSLFFASQGLLTHRGLVTLVTDYLRVASFHDDTGAATATGVADDPIGDGLSLTLSPPFPDYTDDMTPGAGGVAWLNGPSGPVGIRYDSGTFKTVFLSAAFEGISDSAPDPNNQVGVMTRILDWLLPPATEVPQVASRAQKSMWLAQSAPNPFHGSTALRFAIPDAGPVRLTVFNVAGRRVAELVSGTLPAGTHTVRWDGRDDAGRSVASGVYLYRLEAGGERLTKEMILMK
jgi:hypothetical protein